MEGPNEAFVPGSDGCSWRSPERLRRPIWRGPNPCPIIRKLPPSCRPIAGPGSISASTAAAAFGSSNWDSTGSRNISGGLIGGTVGYNYQFGHAVVGVEGDIDWADINGSTTNACPAGCKTSDTWLATVRGRLGYAADRFMPYVTGGRRVRRYPRLDARLSDRPRHQTGWTVGGGLEAALVANWTAKVEYLYVDLGKFNCGINCGADSPTTSRSIPICCARA